jgi:hypothetical protein
MRLVIVCVDSARCIDAFSIPLRDESFDQKKRFFAKLSAGVTLSLLKDG